MKDLERRVDGGHWGINLEMCQSQSLSEDSIKAGFLLWKEKIPVFKPIYVKANHTYAPGLF